jgi:hypothetical protein
MFTNNSSSPLEHLAAFAIVFVSAVISTMAVSKYIDKIRCEAKHASVTVR